MLNSAKWLPLAAVSCIHHLNHYLYSTHNWIRILQFRDRE